MFGLPCGDRPDGGWRETGRQTRRDKDRKSHRGPDRQTTGYVTDSRQRERERTGLTKEAERFLTEGHTKRNADEDGHGRQKITQKYLGKLISGETQNVCMKGGGGGNRPRGETSHFSTPR